MDKEILHQLIGCYPMLSHVIPNVIPLFCFVGVASIQTYHEILTGSYWCVLRREWMGCWRLLGSLFIVRQWIIPENSLRLALVRILILHKLDISMLNLRAPQIGLEDMGIS